MKFKVDYDKNTTCPDACKNVCPNRRLLVAIGEGNYDSFFHFEAFMDYQPEQSGQVVVEAKLFRFLHSITAREIIAKMDAEGYRPAELFELLAFGAKYPERQRKFTIVALGTQASKSGLTEYPCLTGACEHRYLEATWPAKETWGHPERDRFLAIKKSQPSNT